ncbi:MAG: transposase [Betaproteobacteria bacterium]|jgi:putative transposase
MARQARIIHLGQVMAVSAKGLKNLNIFDKDELKQALLAWLRDSAKHYGLSIHAYVILPNELCFLATPLEHASLAKTMQSLCRRYTQLFNQIHLTKGTIWDGRFYSKPLATGQEILEHQKKIETSPKQEGVVSQLEDYLWSSYLTHIGQRPNYGLIDTLPFSKLGNTPFERQRNWELYLLNHSGTHSVPKE